MDSNQKNANIGAEDTKIEAVKDQEIKKEEPNEEEKNKEVIDNQDIKIDVTNNDAPENKIEPKEEKAYDFGKLVDEDNPLKENQEEAKNDDIKSNLENVEGSNRNAAAIAKMNDLTHRPKISFVAKIVESLHIILFVISVSAVFNFIYLSYSYWEL